MNLKLELNKSKRITSSIIAFLNFELNFLRWQPQIKGIPTSAYISKIEIEDVNAEIIWDSETIIQYMQKFLSNHKENLI